MPRIFEASCANKSARRHKNQRPIIYIAHSLGGMVLEEVRYI
jgi:hypothetical protein